VSGIGVICTIVFHASVWNLDENKTDAIIGNLVNSIIINNDNDPKMISVDGI